MNDHEIAERQLVEIIERSSGDTERDHIDADVVLTTFLTMLGYGAVVELYERVPKWYA